MNLRESKQSTRRFLALFLLLLFPLSSFATEEGLVSYSQNNSEGIQIPHFPDMESSTGALLYSVPLSFPEGRGGLSPSLSLEYSSQNTEKVDIVGYGWELNIPKIERINKEGVDTIFTDNYFNSSLSEELVSVSTTTYQAKVEQGDFLSYTFSNNSWAVTDKQGIEYSFGLSAGARQDSLAGTDVYAWMLEKIEDTNGNTVTYEYTKSGGQIYPHKIFYTNNGVEQGIFEIEFVLEARLDDPVTYDKGFKVQSTQRIKEIIGKVSGSWVKKYVFGYTAGDNGRRSLLQSITESGKDDLGTVTMLPPVTFEYQTTSGNWTGTDTWAEWVPTGGTSDDFQLVDWQLDAAGGPNCGWINVGGTFFSGNQGDLVLADIDADGDVDVFRNISGDCGSGHTPIPDDQKVWLNNGQNWVEDTSMQVPSDFYTLNRSPGNDPLSPAFLDVNGDFYPDLVSDKTYLGQGVLGWFEELTHHFPYRPSTRTMQFANYNFIELDGDGIPDFIKTERTQGGRNDIANRQVSTEAHTRKYNGSSIISATTTLSAPVDVRDAVFIFDANGDGLDDFVQSIYQNNVSTNFQRVYLNTGSGWEEDPNWNLPENIYFPGDLDYFYFSPANSGLDIADINGDGLIDIVRSHVSWPYSSLGGALSKEVYLNTGSGWEESAVWEVPMPMVVDYCTQTNCANLTTRITDLNGDGLPDFVQARRHKGWNYEEFKYLSAVNEGIKADLLSSIIHSAGGTTSIEYEVPSKITNPNFPIPVHAVSKITKSDGFGNSWSETYSYEGGYYHYENPVDRQFAGFHLVNKTDGVGNLTKTYFHQGNDTNSTLGETADHIAKLGMPYRTEEYDQSGNTYKVMVEKWERVDLGNNASFIKKTEDVELLYNGTAGHKDKATSFVYNNTNGNLLEEIQRGEVSANIDGTYTDFGTDTKKITYAYATDGGSITGLPKTETLYDYAGVQKAKKNYYYDQLSLGQVSLGNLTKIEEWDGLDMVPAEEYTYNVYGLVTQEKDANQNITTYTYDTHNLHPATKTDPEGNISSYTYDYSSGKVKIHTNPNNRMFTTVYDGLDRVLEEKQPDITIPTTQVTKKTYTYTDSALAKAVTEETYLGGANSATKVTYLDGLDRKIQERSEAQAINEFSVKDFGYDARELLAKESLPYFSVGSSRTAPTTTLQLYTSFAYDPLERISQIATAVGNTTNTYNSWTTTTTDPNGEVKRYTNDAYQNLVQVEEVTGVGTHATQYGYDILNNLTSVTDALSNIRSFVYDPRSRRTVATDLRAPGESTYGTWSYTYDGNGNIASKTDPKGQTITYTYDGLDRVLSEDFVGEVGVEVAYVYDSCVEGKEQLCSVTSSGVTTTYEYDVLGNTAQENRTIDAVTYSTQYEHDRQSNIINITYPDLSETSYTYDSAGALRIVQQREQGGVFEDFLTNITYAPTGKVSYFMSGNGAETTYTYDPNNLYRLINIFTFSPNASETLPGGGAGGGSSSTISQTEGYEFRHKGDVGGVSNFLPPHTLIEVYSVTPELYEEE